MRQRERNAPSRTGITPAASAGNRSGTSPRKATDICFLLLQGRYEQWRKTKTKTGPGKPKLFGKVLPFRFIRIVSDLVCVTVGFVLGFMPGVGTIVTALFMGPLITFFKRTLSDPLLTQPGEPA